MRQRSLGIEQSGPRERLQVPPLVNRGFRPILAFEQFQKLKQSSVTAPFLEEAIHANQENLRILEQQLAERAERSCDARESRSRIRGRSGTVFDPPVKATVFTAVACRLSTLRLRVSARGNRVLAESQRRNGMRRESRNRCGLGNVLPTIQALGGGARSSPVLHSM